jgi:Ca2+-transporting ATPase
MPTLLGVLREPMLLLLAAAAGLYLVLGDPGEALILLVMVALVVVITLVQERRTENAVEALRDLSSPRALVVRAGVRKRIAGRDVVRGDLVVVAEGDRVPAATPSAWSRRSWARTSAGCSPRPGWPDWTGLPTLELPTLQHVNRVFRS